MRPKVVCLCGSTRFMGAFHKANREETLAGHIVLTVELVTYDGNTDPQKTDPEQKKRLDELHLRKIDLADEVLILNVGGYIGESTGREIEYARRQRKLIRWIEEPENYCPYCYAIGNQPCQTLTGKKVVNSWGNVHSGRTKLSEAKRP